MRRFVPRLLQTARTPQLDPRRSESIDHSCVALGTSPVPRTFPSVDARALRTERYVRAPGTVSRFSVAVVPRANAPKKPIEGLTLHAVDRIEEAIAVLRSV